LSQEPRKECEECGYDAVSDKSSADIFRAFRVFRGQCVTSVINLMAVARERGNSKWKLFLVKSWLNERTALFRVFRAFRAFRGLTEVFRIIRQTAASANCCLAGSSCTSAADFRAIEAGAGVKSK